MVDLNFSLAGRMVREFSTQADANKDDALSLRGVNTFLDEHFPKWDRDGSESLNSREFAAAYLSITMPHFDDLLKCSVAPGAELPAQNYERK